MLFQYLQGLQRFRYPHKLMKSHKGLIDYLFATYHFNVVVNLAAQAGVRYSIDHPDIYIHSNIIGFYNLLEAARHDNELEHIVCMPPDHK